MPQASSPNEQFDEAVEFFRQKVNLPSERWADVWAGSHARAFTVAGAMKDDLLVDFRTAIDKALAEGTTLQEFRKDFDAIVKRHGWSYKGSRGWRTRVIYETNLRTAYAAGRWQQMTDPEVLKRRPYLRYAHGDSAHPRDLHLSWDGLILPHDNPWWDAHYPPNGWGCSCRVFSAGERDLKRRGKSGPDEPPNDGSYTWTDKVTDRDHTVPAGIDPGWDYNVGHAAVGKRLPPHEMAEIVRRGKEAWTTIGGSNWKEAGRPKALPLHKPQVPLAGEASSIDEMRQIYEASLGGRDRVFRTEGVALSTRVRVDKLVHDKHEQDPKRVRYAPLIPDTLEHPDEVWLTFQRQEKTGHVRLRVRYLKRFSAGRPKSVLFVADASKGELIGWTFMPTRDTNYVNRQREGTLIFATD